MLTFMVHGIYIFIEITFILICLIFKISTILIGSFVRQDWTWKNHSPMVENVSHAQQVPGSIPSLAETKIRYSKLKVLLNYFQRGNKAVSPVFIHSHFNLCVVCD